MDLSSIASVSTTIAETGIKQQVSVAMLKKAQEIDATTAASLIQALPAVTPLQNLPAHLGNTINTTA